MTTSDCTLAALALAAILAAAPVHSEDLSGPARIIDGDTLEIGTVRIRLFGIDAPERTQRCGGAGASVWDCGKAATAHLASLTQGATVRCTGDDHDRYGRLLATCAGPDGADIGRLMVDVGMARAYARYSDTYIVDEAHARSLALGLWQGDAEAPWNYRADGGFAPASGTLAAEVPSGPGTACAIKGNIGKGGARIYHLPTDPSYARTRIDPRHGEAWFCDEGSAHAAGWRPVALR